MHVVIAI